MKKIQIVIATLLLTMLISCGSGGDKYLGTWQNGRSHLNIAKTGDAYSITGVLDNNGGIFGTTINEMVTYKGGNLDGGGFVVATYNNGKLIYRNTEYTKQ